MPTCGIDVVEISRIKRSLLHPRFLARFFSEEEVAFFLSKANAPQSIAANFAAKEAFAKALGTGFRFFLLKEVSVLRNEQGRPYFLFSGKAKELVEKTGLTFSVSLTHTKHYAAAIVVAGKEEKI